MKNDSTLRERRARRTRRSGSQFGVWMTCAAVAAVAGIIYLATQSTSPSGAPSAEKPPPPLESYIPASEPQLQIYSKQCDEWRQRLRSYGRTLRPGEKVSRDAQMVIEQVIPLLDMLRIAEARVDGYGEVVMELYRNARHWDKLVAR